MSKPLAPRIPSPWLLVGVVPLVAALLLAAGNGRVEAATDYWRSPLRDAPPPGLAEPVTLRLVTFNVADGYLFTTNRPERMRAIARVLRELDPDLVGLQEAFIAADREVLLAGLSGSRLRHHVRFPGATVGNGLWILSAHPILEAWFHRFSDSNPWWRFNDWWAGKGVGLARVALPGGAVVDFFDTHAQAGRGRSENDAVRLGQMEELGGFVREARLPGVPAFVVGDLNTSPGRSDYERAVAGADLVRIMDRASRIDHVLAVDDGHHRFEVLETVEIRDRIPSPRPGIFVGRTPTLGELFEMGFGPPGETELSDHPGYLVTVRVTPVRE